MFKYFALVQIDEGYVLVPTDTNNSLEIKHNFCHKQLFTGICSVAKVIDAEAFTKWIKAYYFRTRCDGTTSGYLVSIRPDEDEREVVEWLLKEYQADGCKVYYNRLMMTEGEYRIADWLLDYSGLDPDGALAVARALGFNAVTVLGVPIPMARR